MSPLLGPPALAVPPTTVCRTSTGRAKSASSAQPIAIVCAAGDSFVGIARMDCLEARNFDDSNCITQPEKSISMSVAYTTDKAAMRGHE
jgi:hypothetical protein